MADGGYDPGEMDMPEYSRTTEETPMETQDTGLTFDPNTQYNTDDTNLETNDDFGTPGSTTPRFHSEESRVMYEHNLHTQTQVEILIATEYQRFAKEKGWKYTKTGLKLLAERSTRRGGRLYYFPDSKEFDVRYEMSKAQRENNSNSRSFCLSEVFNPDKFLTEDRIKSQWGVRFLNHLKRLINTPDPPGMMYLHPMDSDPYTRQIQQQQISPETQKFIDDLLKEDKPIKQLLDATEEQLKNFGCHELFLREWRSVRTLSLEHAKLRQQHYLRTEELENGVKELDDRLKDLNRQYEKAVADHSGERDELLKQIKKLKDEKDEKDEEIKSLRKTDWEASNAQETQGKRLKRLFLDIVKNNSKIPLKDKLQIIFKVEGVTIGSIITTVVMTLSTIGLSIGLALGLTGKSAVPPPKPKPPGPPKPDPQPGPDPQPDPSKPDIPIKVKEGLKKFGEWLKELAKKSDAALPAIIGSIVSFILKSAAAAVGFLAEHMIILVIIIVSSIVYGLVEGVRYIKKSGK